MVDPKRWEWFKHMMYQNLRKKLIIILFMILIPAFLGVSLINFYVQRNAIRQELVRYSLPMVRELIHWEITTRLREPMLAASLMAHDTFVLDWVESGEEDITKIEKYLEEIKLQHNFASAFLVSEHTKNYYSFVGLHKTIEEDNAHDQWYYLFVASGQTVDFDVDTDEVSGEVLTVFINHRLEDANGNFLGVIGVGIDMSGLTELLSLNQSRYGKTIYLVDATGTIQAHSNYDLIEKESILTKAGIKNIALKLLGTKAGEYDGIYHGDNGNVIITSKYIEGVDWYILVEQDEQSVIHDLVINLIRTIVIGLLASLLSILVSTYFINIYQKHIVTAMVTDHLTGAFNRIHLDGLIEKELQQSQRKDSSFSILLFDIDNFKHINDVYGHMVGDTVLKEISSAISDRLLENEHLGRWGGDEFMILLTDASIDEAIRKAEALKLLIEKSSFSVPEGISSSFGVTKLEEGDTFESFIQRADKALYEAKKMGRNTVKAL